MTKYTKDYLTELLTQPVELKKEILLSYGGVLQEMYEQDIIPPLNLLLSPECFTAIGTVLVKVHDKNYDSKEIESFFRKAKKIGKNYNASRENRKTGKTFMDEVLPSMQSYLPKKEDLNISIKSFEDYFYYLNLIEKANLDKELKSKIEKELENLDSLAISNFKEVANDDLLNLLESNIEFIKSKWESSGRYRNNENTEKIIVEIVEQIGLENLSESVKSMIPLSLMFKKIVKSEENIALLRDIVDVKVKNDTLLFGLESDDIDNFYMFDLDYSNEKDKNILLELITYKHQRTYSHEAFRDFVVNSRIAKKVPTIDLMNTFPNANKLGIEFGDAIFGDESIDSIVKYTSLTRNKKCTFRDLEKYLNDGRSYRDEFLKNIEFPDGFLAKLDHKLEENGCTFIYTADDYDREDTIYGDKVGFYTQVLSYIASKQLELIKDKSSISDIELEKQIDILNLITSTFSSLTGRDGYFDRRSDSDESIQKTINVIKVENIITELHKKHLDLLHSKNSYYFDFDNYMKFRKDYVRTNDELSYSYISNIFQKIKNPSWMWSIENTGDPYSRSYSNIPVRKLAQMGLSLDESLKSLLDFPFVDKDALLDNISKIKEDNYETMRSNLVGKTRYLNQYIFVGMIKNTMERDRYSELSDVEFYKHLNAVKHYINTKSTHHDIYSELFKQATELQEKLNVSGLSEKDYPETYVFSIDYLHNNFSIQLLNYNYQYMSGTLSAWKDKYKDNISNDVVVEIILEVFNQYHDKHHKKSNLVEDSKDFIFDFVKSNPEAFESIKDKLLTGPHGNLYSDMFVIKNDGVQRNVVDEMIATENTEELRELFSLLTLDEITKEMGKVLLSKNMKLIDLLQNELPGEQFVEIFNQCKYHEQRVMLENDVLNKYDGYNSFVKIIHFNPETLEDFKEVYEYLRTRERLKIINSNSSSKVESNYYDTKQNWECADILKNIIVPDLDSAINYLIDEAPLSFMTCYQLDVVGSYSGRLPRGLNENEFLKLLNIINEISPGMNYFGHSTNYSNNIYSSVFSTKNNKDDLKSLNDTMDKYLKILERLKKNPKDYVDMFASTQDIISHMFHKILKDKDNNYQWVKLPKECEFLKEVQNIFTSKYQWPQILNEKQKKQIYRDEYAHKFFNLFIDKKIYLEGLKKLREEYLSTEDVSEHVMDNINRKSLYPYSYEVKMTTYKTCYSYDYTEDDINKVSRDILEANPQTLFHYSFPKKKFLRNQELTSMLDSEKTDISMLSDDDDRLASENALVRLIDEDINVNNIWPILMSVGYEKQSIKEDKAENIRELLLGKPDMDLKMINKLSNILKIQQVLYRNGEFDYLRELDNRMLNQVRNGVFADLDPEDFRKMEVALEQLYMEKNNLPIVTTSHTIKPKKF